MLYTHFIQALPSFYDFLSNCPQFLSFSEPIWSIKTIKGLGKKKNKVKSHDTNTFSYLLLEERGKYSLFLFFFFFAWYYHIADKLFNKKHNNDLSQSSSVSKSPSGLRKSPLNINTIISYLKSHLHRAQWLTFSENDMSEAKLNIWFCGDLCLQDRRQRWETPRVFGLFSEYGNGKQNTANLFGSLFRWVLCGLADLRRALIYMLQKQKMFRRKPQTITSVWPGMLQ